MISKKELIVRIIELENLCMVYEKDINGLKRRIKKLETPVEKKTSKKAK